MDRTIARSAEAAATALHDSAAAEKLGPPATSSPEHTTASAPCSETLAITEDAMRAVTVTDDFIGRAAADQLATGGKRLRAHLTLEAAQKADSQGLGAKPADVAWAAAAIELIHQASLIHDDLMDNDTERRGAQAVWERYGDHSAVLLGDHFLAAAFEAAARAPGGSGLVRRMGEAVKAATKGQAAELRGDPPPAWDDIICDYESRARDKSGRLMALPVEAGLLVGDAPDATIERARGSWIAVGAAYQIGDDLAELEGRKTGRTRQSDLVQRRLNAPVAHYLAAADQPEREALYGFLQGGSDESGVALWRDRLRQSEAPQRCLTHINDLIREAYAAADGLPEPLRRLLDTTIHRILPPRHDSEERTAL